MVIEMLNHVFVDSLQLGQWESRINACVRDRLNDPGRRSGGSVASTGLPQPNLPP
jgi:hypothetical protein